eukprot:TRINITY_DN1475_c0_g1_i2.p1 TRINITY_DN1475_c0_g1~~TRINITY_DN1475_c0_g1_i2.p1  ORF type:complete len:140 (-),score=17.56 TRINITY_DN1475_c0_g1_i2:937-1356(-)
MSRKLLVQSLPNTLQIATAIENSRLTRDPLQRFPLVRKPTVSTSSEASEVQESQVSTSPAEPTAPVTPPKLQDTLRDSQRKQILKEEFATVNPFVNETERISPYEWFKIVLFTVTLLAPIRILLCLLIFLIAALFGAIR